MTCLSCPHFVTSDWEDERSFYCGHDSSSELDEHKSADLIVALEYGGEIDRIAVPEWCPLTAAKVLVGAPLSGQKELVP